MASSLPLLSILLSAIPTSTASPISSTHPLTKRSPTPHALGTGFAIALSILLLASLTFYLGVLHGRTGTLLFWRATPPRPSSPTSPAEKHVSAIAPSPLKHQISSPLETHSTALPELSPLAAHPPGGHHHHACAELSPVEARPAVELAALEKALYEMGLATPKRAVSVASVASKRSVVGRSFYSSRKSSVATTTTVGKRKSGVSVRSVRTAGRAKRVYSSREVPPRVASWVQREGEGERERKSWFCKGAMEVESEEMRGRGKENLGPAVGHGLSPGSAAVVVEGKERAKRGTMDWSGMEWLSRVYGERKERRLSGMRSFYIQDGEEKGGV